MGSGTQSGEATGDHHRRVIMSSHRAVVMFCHKHNEERLLLGPDVCTV